MTTELIRGLHNIKPHHQVCIATIGNFDGVHLGHQALLKAVKEKASKWGAPSCLITFEPHPVEFFLPEKMLPRLMRLREKYLAVAEFAIDQMLVLQFDAWLANLTPAEFVKQILVDKLRIKHLVVGDDFRFGKKRMGDVDFLKKAGDQYGFSVEPIPAIILEGQRVSSSRVRQALAEADFLLVQRLQGRSYTMKGRVAHGNKLGRSIGFPTANIHLHRAMTPVQGIYVVRMHGISSRPLQGVANVGTRPTVGGTRTLLEVHLFDFNQDIYGRYMCVEFCKKLRDEERYDTIELLRQQIVKDVEQAKEYFRYERL